MSSSLSPARNSSSRLKRNLSARYETRPWRRSRSVTCPKTSSNVILFLRHAGLRAQALSRERDHAVKAPSLGEGHGAKSDGMRLVYECRGEAFVAVSQFLQCLLDKCCPY